jgi:hypothetical protein
MKLAVMVHGPRNVSKMFLPTINMLESLNRLYIHNAFHELLIEPFRLAHNPMGMAPAPAIKRIELGYDVDGYEYGTSHDV